MHGCHFLFVLLVFYCNLALAFVLPKLERNHCRYSSVTSATLQDEGQLEGTQPSSNFSCNICKTKFSSRNEIFRHLRTDQCTESNPRPPDQNPSDVIVKQSIAIQFAYFSAQERNNDIPVNDWAATEVVGIFLSALETYNHGRVDGGSETEQSTLDFRLQGSRTQCSVANMRTGVLQQEPLCSASEDVLVLTGTCLESSLPQLENMLAIISYGETLTDSMNTDSGERSYQILSCKILHGVTIHAERSCTQMAYQYLLPLSWMPDGELLQNQWKGWEEKPPTDSLKKLKKVLRLAESCMLSASKETELHAGFGASRVANGRYGLLGARERRAWHNFASPSLRGKASPNHESIWRCLDSCRMVGMVNFGQPDACLVLEIKGDAFLPTQVRRIVGTALAIVHGWLPESVMSNESLLSPLYIAETVLAPGGREYLSKCRFHFEESRTSGKQIFESDICGKVIGTGTSEMATAWVQQNILKSPQNEDWMQHVKDVVAPRIIESIQMQRGDSTADAAGYHGALEPAPQKYGRVLEELRAIVEEKRWPETSTARSTVIRNATDASKLGTGGSFTLANPKLLELSKDDSTPLANQLFPELVESIFQLEEDICADAQRLQLVSDGQSVEYDTEDSANGENCALQLSSHCAVNAQAQFTPHVDSGRGAGQSISLIVGLGDYEGGELFVEGVPCGIRYTPLEFDGWSLRHWTNHYVGERFSLVWFTPDT